MAELNTVARPYTKAAFEFAAAQGNLDQWSQMLKDTAAVVSDNTVAGVLSNPALTSEQKAEILSDLLGDQVSDEGKNFIAVLAENRRLPLLPVISAQFEQAKANQLKSVDIELTTAFDLEDEQQQKLTQALSAKLGRDVNITPLVDNSIIGGVVVRADDLVIDGSVRARIAKLAEAMNS